MRGLSLLKNQFSTSSRIKPKICIVGAGAAGFYAAQSLVKNVSEAQVDIYEKLPVPFGLVRFGVAPDHPEVKNVINTFTKTALHERVRFLGNVNIGKDVTIEELRNAYHVVLLAYGADENRLLNIPGENLGNVLSARNIVGWYNGTPWDKDLKIDLSGERAVIFGQGNVAMDIARILLTPIDVLKKTDITQHSLEQLSTSKVKEVFLVGRRGPLQAAFTIKELREMLKLPECQTNWSLSDFKGVSEAVPALARPKKRIIELMLKSAIEPTVGSNKFNVIFFRSPIELSGNNKVEKVKLGVNKLKGVDLFEQQAVLTETLEEMECDLAVTSIGYKSLQIDKEIPFDDKKGIAKNDNFKISKGYYASGWLATGPTGVILTTMNNAFATADFIIKDLVKDDLLSENKEGFDGIFKSKNMQIVDWNGWMKIDKYEQEQGKLVGKPREKILDIKKMLEIAA